MAINLNNLEASKTRWQAPSLNYPTGSFINGTGQGKRDGSYCKAEWANEIFGFFGALLKEAGLSLNNQPETAQNSQYRDAIKAIIFKNFVSLNNQDLNESAQNQALTNLGVFEALEELIEENGGTVPQTNSLLMMSVDTQSSDPWAEYD